MESNKIIYIKQDGFDFAFIEVSEEYIKRQQEQLSKNPYRCGLLEEGETFDLLPEQEYLGKQGYASFSTLPAEMGMALGKATESLSKNYNGNYEWYIKLPL